MPGTSSAGDAERFHELRFPRTPDSARPFPGKYYRSAGTVGSIKHNHAVHYLATQQAHKCVDTCVASGTKQIRVIHQAVASFAVHSGHLSDLSIIHGTSAVAATGLCVGAWVFCV